MITYARDSSIVSVNLLGLGLKLWLILGLILLLLLGLIFSLVPAVVNSLTN